MAAIQKLGHVRVTTLNVAGTDIKPQEAPAYPAEDATREELNDAFVDLIATLIEAGILTPRSE